MRRKLFLESTETIASIRGLQRLAAEKRLIESKSAIKEAEHARDGSARRLDDDEAAWLNSISGRFEPGVAGQWASAVVVAQEDLHFAQAEVRRKQRDTDRALRAFGGSIARSDAATELSRVAARRVRRLHEETAMGEVADRHSQQWVRT